MQAYKKKDRLSSDFYIVFLTNMGSFNINSPLQMGSQFSLVGDTFSPSQTHTLVDCTLYFGISTVVSTQSSCDPTSPTFTYNAGTGTYHVYEENGTDNWTSNDLSYTAPTPTLTPTPQITPIYVDIASGSAISQGVYHMFVYQNMVDIIILFFLIMLVMYHVIRRVM